LNIPAQIINGDSVTWLDSATVDNLRNAVSPPDWTLSYAIRGPAVLTLTATQSGSGWTTTMSKTQSAALTPGNYYWQAYATKASERVTIGSGKLVVTPNLSIQNAGFDGRTQNEIDLAAVQAAMRAMIAGGAVQKYVIANRQVEKMSMADLITLESKLKFAVKKEQAAADEANGLGNPHNSFVRFT
jgi:hypothetical protein